MKENISLRQLVDVLATYTERITDASSEILDSDIAQNTTAIIESVGESLAEASKVIKFLKAVDSIPTKLYMICGNLSSTAKDLRIFLWKSVRSI